jgi:hypothetical protein
MAGTDRLGQAGHCSVWQAGHGKAGSGMDRLGAARIGRPGADGLGGAGRGKAWPPWLGRARHGSHGPVWTGTARFGLARRGWAGEAGLRLVRPGLARSGRARQARLGTVRFGGARLGAADNDHSRVLRSTQVDHACPEVTVALTVDQLDQRILAEHDWAVQAELHGDLHTAKCHRHNTDVLLDMRAQLIEYEGAAAEVPC